MISGTAKSIETEDDPVWQTMIWPLTRRYFESDEAAQHPREESDDVKLVILIITTEKKTSQNSILPMKRTTENRTIETHWVDIGHYIADKSEVNVDE